MNWTADKTQDIFEARYAWDANFKPLEVGARVTRARNPKQFGTVQSICVPRCHVIWDGEEDAGGTFPFICRLVQLGTGAQRVA